MPATVTDRLYGENSSVAVKAPVRVASAGTNLTLSGLQTVGGITLAEGDRILVKDQNDPTQNGIYNVSVSAWKRSGDFDGANDVVEGSLVVVLQGATGIFYQLNTVSPVIGTTAMVFVQVWQPPSITYPQTPAEITAGVTPTNTAYVPYNVLRYGADATGVSDSAAAFNAAHSIVGANVVYPQGTFKIASNLNVPRCASIIGAGGYLFSGTVLKPQAGVTKLFSITSTGGNYPEYIGRFAIDGTATSNATAMVLGDSAGAIHVDVTNLYIGNFTGETGLGIKVADTLQTWFRHVYVFGCGTNWQLSGDAGFPTTTRFTQCYASAATAGQGLAIISGYDIVFDHFVCESNFAEGCKIIPAASGVCRNIVFNQPWFEANGSAYHFVADGSAASSTLIARLNEPYFATSADTALAANITGANADVIFRAPTFTSSLSNNIIFQSSAYGRIDQWDSFWSYVTNVTDSSNKVVGWEGPLGTWSPTITASGGSAALSAITITMARWRRVAVNMLLIELSWTATVTGAGGVYMQVTIPSGFTLQGTNVRIPCLVTDVGTEVGGALLTDGSTNVRFYKLNSATYGSSGTVGGTCQALLEISG